MTKGGLVGAELTGKIIGCAIEVHRTLGGPGLLESVYEEALCHELVESGFTVQRQLSAPISYKGRVLSTPLCVDLLVDGQVVVECKAVAEYNKAFAAQTLTYLRLLNLRIGLVINFGEIYVRDGVHRVVNRLQEADRADG